MTRAASAELRRLADGSLWSMLAELAAAPLGLALAIYLTRRLGPDGFGVFALCLAPVLAIEHTLASLFARTTTQVVATASDWQRAATRQLRWHTGFGVVAGLVVLAAAAPIAGLLDEPRATTTLRLFALDIPAFSLAMACRNVLTARGRYRPRALIGLVRSAGRLALVVTLVELGASASSAAAGHVLGSTIAALVGLLLGAYPGQRPRGEGGRHAATPALWIAGAALAAMVLERMDLYLLKGLGAGTDIAGTYAAAQTLALAIGLLSAAYSTPLLSTLARLRGDDDAPAARALGALTLRGFLVLLPFALTASATSEALVTLAFGQTYAAAASPLAVLLIAGLAMVTWDLNTSFLTAWDHSRAALLTSLLVVAGALGAQLVAIPRWGYMGAATVTCAAAVLGLTLSTALVCHLCAVRPRRATIARAAFLSILALGGTRVASELGGPPLLVLAVISVLLVVAWGGSGELSRDEVARLRAWLTTRRGTSARGPGT